jgi:hypothetical protein
MNTNFLREARIGVSVPFRIVRILREMGGARSAAPSRTSSWHTEGA